MEEVFQRFPHLSEGIFKSLDNKTLANSAEVSRFWYAYIDYQNFHRNRRIEMIQETIRKFHQLNVEFRKSFDTTHVQNILNAARMGDFETAQNSMMEGISDVYYNFVAEAPASTRAVHLSPIYKRDFTEDSSTLHWAADNGYFDVVRHTVDITGDKNPRDKYGNKPLHYAAFKGHLNIVKYLVEKEVKSHITGLIKINDRNPRNKSGYTPLHVAALRGHLDVVKYLVDRIDDSIMKNPKNDAGITPLHEAAKMGHIDVVKYIVANIDEREKNLADKLGATALQLALNNQHFDVAKLLYPLYRPW